MPKNVGDVVARLGFSRIREMEWWEEFRDGKLSITHTPSRHWGARMLRDFHRGFGGYVVRSGRAFAVPRRGYGVLQWISRDQPPAESRIGTTSHRRISPRALSQRAHQSRGRAAGLFGSRRALHDSDALRHFPPLVRAHGRTLAAAAEQQHRPPE